MSPENLRLRFPVALVEDLLRTLPEGAFAANRGAGPVDLTGLEQLPLRLSAMVHDLPQITEADLNPLLARPDGITAVDVRVRVLPHRGHDPYLRRLR
nr:acetate--CoA ligase family protein [Streptomyces sp. CNQ-509]